MSIFYRLQGLLFILLLPLSGGCGYQLTNSSFGAIANSKTVWIPFFVNETVSPTAQTVLRRVFYDEFHALRGISPAIDEASADLVVKAKIISYSNRALSYNALDQAMEYALTLNTELEISKKDQKKPLFKGQLQASKQYMANTNLALQHNSEEQALDGAGRIIAQKFISNIEESY